MTIYDVGTYTGYYRYATSNASQLNFKKNKDLPKEKLGNLDDMICVFLMFFILQKK